MPEISFLQNFYVRLVQHGVKDGPQNTKEVDYSTIEPYLAASWDQSSDGLVYTFHLKDGFKFPSGKPVDAEAVRYSLQRVLDMAGCGRFFLTDGHLDPVIIEKIEAVDPKTVKITLNAPNGNMLGDLATHAGSIVDPSLVEANGGVKAGAPNEWMSSNVAPSGPFLLESYSPNQKARMVANPGFAGTPPASSAINVNWISAAPTLLLQARTGQADITFDLSKQAARSLEGNSGTRVIAYSNPFVQQLMINNKQAPWDNVKVREAAALAIPYDDIVKKLAYGWGTAYYGPIPPSLPGFNAELSKPLGFDIEKAKALIAESGVATPIKAELTIQEGDAAQQQLATIVQSTWAKIGIDLSIRVAPAAEFQDLTQGHKIPAFMRLDGPGVFETGYYWGYDLICGISFNLTDTCLPAADPLIAEMRASSDTAKRQEIMDKVTTMWREQYPKILFYEDKPVVVLSDAVTSFTFSPLPDYRYWAKK
ncbi:ABC transporter substrate-binding protein [Kaistia nematophila]|uniref:ABC transporter substrate-binding protein n=1 Tax=Kaistia nematophila TaxID=2994654 RepID=A0A9X3INY8_9HYPH|nr:ABC transporter substrate-binding protein [Kaistia nematophila]MCX5571385.1 ABC transporter substrate-binding protein [Kaistia nematophila]